MTRFLRLMMFGMLWAMLLANFAAPVRTNGLIQIVDTVGAITRTVRNANHAVLEQFHSNIADRHWDLRRTQPYYNAMQRIHDTFQHIQAALAVMETGLRNETDPRNRLAANFARDLTGRIYFQLCRSAAAARSPLLHDDNFNKLVEYSISKELDAVKQILLIPQPVSRFALQGLFKKQSCADAVAILIAIRYDMAILEQNLLNRLYISGSPSCDLHFTSISWFALQNQGIVFPGETVRASIQVASFYNPGSISAILSNTGKVVLDGRVGTLRLTARGLGWQTVHGFTDVRMGDTAVRRLPWSFRYFTGAGAAQLVTKHRPTFLRDTENPVDIDGLARFPLGSLTLTATGAKVLQTSIGHYSIHPATQSRAVVLRLLLIHDGQTDTLEQGQIPVIDAPLPRLAIEGRAHTELSVCEFQQASGITTHNEEGATDPEIQIEQFTLRLESATGDSIGTFLVIGSVFSNNQLAAAAVSRLQPGDRVFIQAAQIRDKSSRTFQPADLYLKLK
jgi:hypothetical protein